MAGFVKTVLTFHWLMTLLLMGLSGLLSASFRSTSSRCCTPIFRSSFSMAPWR